jgi:MFS family permease
LTDDERETVPSDEDTRFLDDSADRIELRDRYYGLLQELRVVLPGVQVLLAFLLTAPFASRFEELDGWGRRAYEVALTSSMLSVVFLLGPTFLHRFGERTARRDRLLWSIRLMVVGLALLAVSLLTAMWGVARFVYGGGSAFQLVVPVAAAMVAVWVVVPLKLRRRGSTDPVTRRGAITSAPARDRDDPA